MSSCIQLVCVRPLAPGSEEVRSEDAWDRGEEGAGEGGNEGGRRCKWGTCWNSSHAAVLVRVVDSTSSFPPYGMIRACGAQTHTRTHARTHSITHSHTCKYALAHKIFCVVHTQTRTHAHARTCRTPFPCQS